MRQGQDQESHFVQVANLHQHTDAANHPMTWSILGLGPPTKGKNFKIQVLHS